MATSLRCFKGELYEEHLVELSSLYEQSRAYLFDSEMSWPELDDIESRAEAHIDALFIGGEPAVEISKRICSQGDFGDVYGAMCVFCRQDRSDLAYNVIQNLSLDDEELVCAVVDALRDECPPSWHDDLLRIMLGRCTHCIPVIARVLAYRGVAAQDTLLRVLPFCPETQLAHMAWALGRIGSGSARAPLGVLMQSDDEVLAAAACRALIRLGDYDAIRHGLLVAQAKPWPILSLGIGGNHTAINVLTDIVKGERGSDDALIALGMLGELKSVNTIFNCLTNPEHAMAAATALQIITGAVLYEEVFVPDEIDLDELFDEERERYEQTGEMPKRGDGQPFGENVMQISVNPETWRAWLTEHKSEFDPKLRYRHGKPCSPSTLVESLAAEHTPNRVRALICDELVVRYQAPVRLEIDMPVREQLQHLAELAQWAQANQSKFKPGVWYFAGQPMD